MYELMMVDWEGVPVPDSEKGVLRRVAIELRAVYTATEVGFVHELCEGVVEFDGDGSFGNSGGLFFKGFLDSVGGEPRKIRFFIPRSTFHQRIEDGSILIGYDQRTGEYPTDIDPKLVRGEGALKITVRKE